MNTIPISFTFKGERNYIQGPDIFNKIVANFTGKELKGIRFTAHSFIEVPNGVMYTSDSSEEIQKLIKPDTRCQLQVNGKSMWVAINASDKPVSDAHVTREEYDETKVTERCLVSHESISIQFSSPYSFIETIVSMNKHLHKTLFPNVEGKWIFTRLDMDKFIETNSGITLTLKHNLNFRLTKSDVYIDEDKVGVIYFSLLK